MEEQKKFLKSEYTKINLDKWLKGIELKRDPGEEYIMEWVTENSQVFRKKYNYKKIKTLQNDLEHLLKKVDSTSKKRTIAALKSLHKRISFLTDSIESNGHSKNGKGDK